MTVAAFRFDEAAHRYTDLEGRPLHSITQLLVLSGHTDPRYYTEASRMRGTAVHDLTAELDLRADDLAGQFAVIQGSIGDHYRGYLLAYTAARRLIDTRWVKIEQGNVHLGYRFAGKPDRVGFIMGRAGVLELKTGAEEKSHALQTALQAILEEADLGVPADAQFRGALYLDGRGKFKLREHKDRRDFDEARRILKAFCR